MTIASAKASYRRHMITVIALIKDQDKLKNMHNFKSKFVLLKLSHLKMSSSAS